MYWRERGTWHRRRFNDSDIDDMVSLATIVDPELKARCYQRIGDIALFMSGIFPEEALRRTARTRSTLHRDRSLQDYERDGRRFYELAADNMDAPHQAVLGTLAAKFGLARSALTDLSQRFLREHRASLFGPGPQPD